MQTYICKCGKTFEKASKADTTGYVLTDYSPQHECYGCPYIVTERDWKTKEIIKRECRATPQITYLTRCGIGTDSGDHRACHIYSLDLVFIKRVLNFINTLDGAENHEHSIPKEWRAADFGQIYKYDNCFGLGIFPLFFQKNKSGTEARRAVKERFFDSNGYRKDMTEEKEKEIIMQRIEIAKENARNEFIKTTAASDEEAPKEEKHMSAFNISAFISQQEQLKQIDLELLVPYHNHKFKLYEGERLDDMVNSIKANGVLTPIIVRSSPDNNGKYEILAGHNRCNAARKAGLHTVPGIIKENLSDDEAEMYVIETNLMQRGFNDLSISEQAAVVAMRHSQMFDESKRAAISRELQELENSPVGNSDSAEKISKLELAGEEYGLSKNSVARLIRVDKLIPELKEWTDTKELSVRAAVELSYISEAAQTAIVKKHKRPADNSIVKIDIPMAKQYREMFEGFDGTIEQASNILKREAIAQTEQAVMKSKPPKPIKISMQPDMFKKYFKEGTKPDEIADTIEKALEMYFSRNENRDDSDNEGIEKFDFSIQTYNSLKRQRINTAAELKALMKDQSTAENILGIKAVVEIIEKIDLSELDD